MDGKDEMVKELKGLNPKNFKVLNPYYTKDDKKVYFSKEYVDIQEVQNVDVKSFEALRFKNVENKDDFGKDKNKVYLFGLELKDVKPEKFQVVKEPITEKIIYTKKSSFYPVWKSCWFPFPDMREEAPAACIQFVR